MSIVHSLPDTASLIVSFSDICLAGAFIGCLFMLVEAGFVVAFRDEKPDAPVAPAPLTMLKPLHGAEPDLPERLAAFCRQEYGGPVQVLCGTPDPASPAVAAIRALRREQPGKPVELHVDARAHGSNRKVSNLINMLPHVRHDTLVLSDSDIVVGPGYAHAIAALLARRNVGAVTCLYHGISGEGLWERLSALAINSHFLPEALTAVSLGLTKPCFGATIALRRSMLERIGGFAPFADELADDYAIGLAVRAAGYEVAIAPFLVGHRCFESSLRQLARHQVRVARTIKNIDPVGYAGSIITHPLPLALLGMLSGSAAAALVAVAALASRLALCRCVERRFDLPRECFWLIPLQDFIAFGIYVASFFGATVHWRGADYRVASDGTLIEEDLRRS
jgi:ceramide glucosyltransferase